MSTPVQWKIGDPCPNCGGEMRKVPRPSAERVRAAADPMNGVPVPQTFDTAPDHQIDELGDLYRCNPCDSKVRVKPPAPAGAGTGA
jgi:DNA-directed RNA polymerase subunit RPC12/RpoP